MSVVFVHVDKGAPVFSCVWVRDERASACLRECAHMTGYCVSLCELGGLCVNGCNILIPDRRSQCGKLLLASLQPLQRHSTQGPSTSGLPQNQHTH